MANNTQAIVPQFAQPPRQRRAQLSNDNNLVKSAQETHNAESEHLDVTPVLSVVENMLRIAASGIDSVIKGTTENVYASDEKVSATSFGDDMFELSNVIHKISCEMFCKCSGGDAHSSTVAIFKMLSYYPWEAKVVLALAGFSVTYGEFWLVAQLCTTSPLAKSVAHLKQVSNVIQNSQQLKPLIDVINSLIAVILDVTKRIVEFNSLETEYLSHDSTQISVIKDHIPTAAYWTIKSIVACAWNVTSLPDIQHEQIGLSNNEEWELKGFAHKQNEVWELKSFVHKLINIHDLLAKELESCRKYIAERRYEEEYRILIKTIESSHLDNMKILKVLITTRDDKPLFFGTEKTTVSIETLRRKHVLLLISDLTISAEDILILEHFYNSRMKPDTHYDRNNAREAPYEIVWIPMIDRVKVWNEDRQRNKFEELKAMMPWHVVHDPATIEPPVVKYIREKWRFERKSVIVALDSLGKVLSTNAMSMMWIWGNSAFPFSHEREEALWGSESWTLKLVIDGLVPDILQWVMEDRYVCLFGGDDIDWIREFTSRAKSAAQILKIPLELFYVEKSNVSRERLKKIKAAIETEKMSEFWDDAGSSWFFWSRLDAMRCSKARHGKTNIDTDAVLKEVMVLLSYDGSEQGWVAVWLGGSRMARANGQLTMQALREFEKWQEEAGKVGLVPALELELERLHTPLHCTRLILPGVGEDMPNVVRCTECKREMERFFLFRCCTD